MHRKKQISFSRNISKREKSWALITILRTGTIYNFIKAEFSIEPIHSAVVSWQNETGCSVFFRHEGCLACSQKLVYCSENHAVFVSGCSLCPSVSCSGLGGVKLPLWSAGRALGCCYSSVFQRAGVENGHRIMYEGLRSRRLKCCRVWQSESVWECVRRFGWA